MTRHPQVWCKSVCAPQVETQKDHSLRRRIQSLQCFLFEQLHKELNQAQSQSQPQPNLAQGPGKAPNSPLPTTSEPATSVSRTAPPAIPSSQSTAMSGAVSGTPSDQSMSSSPGQSLTDTPNTVASLAAAAATDLEAAADTTLGATAATSSVTAVSATASEAAAGTASGAAGQEEAADGQQDLGGQAALQDAAVEGVSRKTVIDGTFGIVVKQRTKVLTGGQADKSRESRSFQVHTASQSLLLTCPHLLVVWVFMRLYTYACCPETGSAYVSTIMYHTIAFVAAK